MENLKQEVNGSVVLMAGNRKMLLDNWKVAGTKQEDLFKYLKNLENATKIIPCRTDAIQIFTLDHVDLEKKEFVGYRHGAEYGTIEDDIPFVRMKKYEGMTSDLSEEVKNKSKMFILIGNDIFYVTKKALPTLAQRAGSSTGKFASMDSLRIRFHRDAGYVSFMQACPSSCNILIRKYDNAKKIFAVFSDGYMIISQKELLEAIMQQFGVMGRTSIYYSIDNFNTCINLEFPEFQRFDIPNELKQDIVPGILVQMSDTGESSFSIIGTLRAKTGITYVPGAVYTRKHTKNASVETIAAEAFKLILPKFEKFPHIVKSLYGIGISNIEETVTKVVAHCGIKASVSAKVAETVLNSTLDSLQEFQYCTALDVASAVVEACDLISEDTCDKVSEKLRSCSVKAFLFRYAPEN